MATREETKKMIEVMQAFVDGKKIESTFKRHLDCGGYWFDIDESSWNWNEQDYRIKVQPKFKVGDYVRILNGREIENYRHGWVDAMDKYIGYIFKIDKVHESNGIFCYTSDVRPYYTYDERGLELVEI